MQTIRNQDPLCITMETEGVVAMKGLFAVRYLIEPTQKRTTRQYMSVDLPLFALWLKLVETCRPAV